MVRWASGVTKIRQRAVGVAELALGGLEDDAIGLDIVAEDAAQLVVADLADDSRRAPPSEASPAMVLAAEPPETSIAAPITEYSAVGARGIDQGHGALDHPLFDQKVFIGIGQYIDDGVADTDDVEKPFGHGLSALN